MVPNTRLAKSDSEASPEGIQHYQTLVGKVMYDMISTRPDIAFTVSQLSQYTSNPSPEHENASKHLLRYLHGTTNAGITFQGSGSNPNDVDLIGYTDASYGDNVDSNKSTSRYVFTVAGGAVSWKSKKQSIVALSSMESEYIAMTEATKEAIWLSWIHRDILETLQNKWELVKNRSNIKWELTDPMEQPFEDSESVNPVRILRTDSQSAIDLAENPKHHDRSKHIAIRHHFVREAIENGHIELEYVPSSDMVADALTKALPMASHSKHARNMGLRL
jgi:hypothetical protein